MNLTVELTPTDAKFIFDIFDQVPLQGPAAKDAASRVQEAISVAAQTAAAAEEAAKPKRAPRAKRK